ncbi:MAG: CDP-alcohol phosphatidyltransferase family protein [Bdellovibrionales bacterium]|nr:CDP-alcohol phosphatidyltransferase family protein [Bdellovibrionales bacterium]
MIDNPFRQHLPKFVQPLIAFYKFLGLSPNQISILSLFISFYCLWLIISDQLILALIVWWAGRLLDGTDGIYARQTHQASAFGAYLDIVCDMASYSLVVIGLSVTFPEFQMQWMLMVFFYVLCIASALSLGALEAEHGNTKDNRGLRLGAGLAEGGETGIAYSVFFVFPQYLSITTWVWVAILFTTVVSRTILAHSILKR